MPRDAITHALLAIVAADDGDTSSAQAHLVEARRCARTTARRHRQIVEIASLVVAGARARAAGLVLEHLATFPDDVGLLARVADAPGTQREHRSPGERRRQALP